MSRKKRKTEYWSDESDYSDNKEEEDNNQGETMKDLWRQNEHLCKQCQELQKTVKSLRTEFRVSKLHERQTKQQIRIDYEWDREEANLSNNVSNWVRTYLFPCYKFLKDGWMDYNNSSDNSSKSLSSFVQRKMKMEQVADFRGQWERVICPTIQMNYVTIRCNLNNKVCKAYTCKLGQ
jgi:hypothetical protein